ncbi:MAG: TetR/AcrR family transcriptional regulator [Leptospira sp.]|nr:TetR/AcrR family transcriptional regulator [Leptospira sp.]
MENFVSARDRILNSALDLFYKNGYTETGINEILEHSGTFKKSFYIHFSSKTELGVLYIEQIEEILLNLCSKILSKHPIFIDFSHAWVKITKKKISKLYPQGCPLVNLPVNTKEIQERNQAAFENLKKPFVKYFINNYKISENESRIISEEILMLYEGAMNSFKLDPNPKYFDYMEKFLKIIDTKLQMYKRE